MIIQTAMPAQGRCICEEGEIEIAQRTSTAVPLSQKVSLINIREIKLKEEIDAQPLIWANNDFAILIITLYLIDADRKLKIFYRVFLR
jgi:hypothetical protein